MFYTTPYFRTRWGVRVSGEYGDRSIVGLELDDQNFLLQMGNRGTEKLNEPRHDKTSKMAVLRVKTQISLGVRPVWSESSLSARRNLGPLATHWAHSAQRRLWFDWADTQADVSLRWAHTYFIGFDMLWLKFQGNNVKVPTPSGGHLAYIFSLYISPKSNLDAVFPKHLFFRLFKITTAVVVPYGGPKMSPPPPPPVHRHFLVLWDCRVQHCNLGTEQRSNRD